MKNLIILMVIITTAFSAYGKKVKFAVDMSDQTVNATGVHVAGDFQVIAGFPTDWDPAATPLVQEGSSNIYSVVVDIPANAKYNYKFLNGDQWYDVEFVPEKSRVGYDFDDNRWTYIDSTANDTTSIGAVMFGGNAPKNMFLAKFYVDLSKESSINTKGVHIASDFNSWKYDAKSLYSFGSKLYEIITYLNSGVYKYKFVNGGLSTNAEVLPGECSQDGARYITIISDTLINKVCFANCVECNALEVLDNYSEQVVLSPNPMDRQSILKLNPELSYDIVIRDINGSIISRNSSFSGSEFIINKNDLSSGIYFIVVKANNVPNPKTFKLIVN